MIGHAAVREQLEAELPPVILLIGPPSVGKTTLARHLSEHHHRYQQFMASPILSAATARDVVQRAGIRGHDWTFILRLDGATETAQNILLKVLEEPPDNSKFILTASVPPLPTVMSRSRVFRLGLLSDGEVAQVLMQVAGMDKISAAAAARPARGQVAAALQLAAGSEDIRVRSVVSAAVRAARDGNIPTLDMALRSWSQQHSAALRTWALEAASGRWVHYSPDFALDVTAEQARRVLRLLAGFPEVGVNAAAVSLVRAFRGAADGNLRPVVPYPEGQPGRVGVRWRGAAQAGHRLCLPPGHA